MKKINFIAYFFFALATIGVGSCKKETAKLTPAVKTQKLRVFIIGNSFSQNATKYLPDMANENGKLLEFGRAETGSGSLQNHWVAATAFEASSSDANGAPYGGKSLKTLLSEGKWDIISLQQYSLLSADESSYEPYTSELVNYVKKIQPDAKIVFHQTWAYRSDAKTFSRVSAGVNAQTAQEMWEKSKAAYQKTAAKYNAQVIPTGDAFQNLATDPLWGFKRDETIDPSKFVYPNVQNEPLSLNVGHTWTADKKITTDYNHANTAGCYLGALVWYGFLYKSDPTKLKFKPTQISAEFAERLKLAAKISLN